MQADLQPSFADGEDWLSDRVLQELGRGRESVLWIESSSPGGLVNRAPHGRAVTYVPLPPLSWLSVDRLPAATAQFDVVACAGVLGAAHPLLRVIERAASLVTSNGAVLVEQLCWERLDVETGRWFFGFQDAIARERRCRVSKRLLADRLNDWRAEHAGLKTGVEIVDALGRFFQLASVEYGPYLGRLLDWDTATEYEQTALDAGVIQATGLRVVGVRTA